MCEMIADRLRATKNRPAGFDWMRILLASSIVGWHSIVTSYGLDVQHRVWTNPIWHPLLGLLLGMFFALSGFLVSGSLERCRTLISFAGLRIMRIFPALVVETLLSAFVLGPLLTGLAVADYFSGAELRSYLWNVLGIVHFTLPGLFLENPLPKIVNGQLWTVPFELRCYEVLIVISALGLYARKWALLCVALLLTIMLAASHSMNGQHVAENLSGNQLVLSFLFGVALFRFRAEVRFSGWLAALSAVLSVVLLEVPDGGGFAPIPLAYLTVYLGLLNPPRIPLLFSGDYSYGLFLYGFPVQQAVASAGPWAQHWYVSVGIGFPLTALIAVSSWWLIEKPFLARKAVLIRLEDKLSVVLHAGRAWLTGRAAGPNAPYDRSTVGPARNRDVR